MIAVYRIDELDFVDKVGNVLSRADITRVDGMDGLWDVKDLWIADDTPMVTIENETGDIRNVPTQCVLRI